MWDGTVDKRQGPERGADRYSGSVDGGLSIWDSRGTSHGSIREARRLINCGLLPVDHGCCATPAAGGPAMCLTDQEQLFVLVMTSRTHEVPLCISLWVALDWVRPRLQKLGRVDSCVMGWQKDDRSHPKLPRLCCTATISRIVRHGRQSPPNPTAPMKAYFLLLSSRRLIRGLGQPTYSQTYLNYRLSLFVCWAFFVLVLLRPPLRPRPRRTSVTPFDPAVISPVVRCPTSPRTKPGRHFADNYCRLR